MRRFILALDSGTSSCRALLFNENGSVAAMAQKPLRSVFPQPGWVEQDADDIWATTLSVAVEAMSRIGAKPTDIHGIGITNQRETTLLWDKASGQPVAPAIVWQCRRTTPIVERLKKEGFSDFLIERTGLVLDPYFSATKIMWQFEQSSSLFAAAKRGDILFGTVDAWLIYKLTGAKVHATDITNASRTQLFNIHTRTWDDDILQTLDIPRSLLPDVVPSASIIGKTDPSLFGAALPIASSVGDQQAALIGHGGVDTGAAKCTFGTGCFLLMNTGSVAVKSQNGLLTTIAYGLEDDVRYALEGSVFTAGQAISWLKDELDFLKDEADSDAVSRSVSDTNGVYVVPAFTGLGAPYWDPSASGTIVGLTAGANKAHIVRATVESLAYQAIDVLQAMRGDSGLSVSSLHVDGGASKNDHLLQTLADLHNDTVVRPADIEATAKGAAFLAGIALGIYTKKTLPVAEKSGTTFRPSLDEKARAERLHGWHKAVRAARAFGDD